MVMLVYQRVSQSTPKKHIAKSVWNPIPTRKLVSSWFPIVFPGNFEPWPWLPSGLPTHGLAGDFEVKPSDQWFPAWPRGSPCRWSKATKMTQVRLGAGHKMTCNRWPAFQVGACQRTDIRILISPHDDSSHFITCAKSQKTPAQNTCWMCSSRILWSFASLGHFLLWQTITIGS